MTKDQALNIIKLKQTHTLEQVAELTNLSVSTVRYWLRIARKQGIAVPPPQKSGRKPLNLRD